MGVKLNGSSSGSVELNAPADTTSGADVVLTLPVNDGDSGQYLQTNGSGALSWQTVTDTNTNLTRGTAIDATAGSPSSIDIDLSSLPTGIRRITLILDALSTNGTSKVIVQLGTGGTPATSGYSGSVSQSTTGVGTENMSTGFEIDRAENAGAQRCTTMVLCNTLDDRWVASSITGRTDSAATAITGGRIDLGGTLDIIRITTLGGTNTFDTGRINILYEV